MALTMLSGVVEVLLAPSDSMDSFCLSSLLEIVSSLTLSSSVVVRPSCLVSSNSLLHWLSGLSVCTASLNLSSFLSRHPRHPKLRRYAKMKILALRWVAPTSEALTLPHLVSYPNSESVPSMGSIPCPVRRPGTFSKKIPLGRISLIIRLMSSQSHRLSSVPFFAPATDHG